MSRHIGNPLALAVALTLGVGAVQAQAAPVLVLHGTHVQVRNERFLGPTELPATAAPRSASARAGASAVKKPPAGRQTRDAIDALLAQGAIDQPTRDARQAELRVALRVYKSLTGTRRLQLGAVIANTDAMAAAGQLVPARLGPVFGTLDANVDWWQHGPLLASGQRVSVGDSPLIWQYYPGQGIQLQMLANFGKANALWSGKKKTALRALLDALVPLAVDRGGWPAWEYYFKFGGGSPPWTSSISQGTAVQALGRAGQLLADPALTAQGAAALAAFEQAPPSGVRVDTDSGPLYAIYSFAPGLRVINAHLQALVGLYDFAQITGDARALGLFQQGDAEAQAVLPQYDTGLWSMYDQNHESDLSYHNLVTGFLGNLCKRTATPLYCDTAARFKADLTTTPSVTPTTSRIRAGAPAKLAFSLDKISRVGLVVSQGSRTLYATSAVVGRGSRTFMWSRPAAPGVYEVRVVATDLAGNRSQPATRTLRVLQPRKHAGLMPRPA
ncbi:MAG: D-glucuronyl C5-epimerase family protein [Thermoleophilaceae bacterium]